MTPTEPISDMISLSIITRTTTDKSTTHRGQLEEDHRMAEARVQRQGMSIPLVVKAGRVGALRMGAGHSSGTQ